MPAPEAEPFSTRGQIGSGLPFCIPSLDVSNYVYVNPMTLEQATALYWDFYSVNIPAESIVAEVHVTDDPDTEDQDETYDEVLDWTVITAPVPSEYDGDPVTIVPFKEGTTQFEQPLVYRDQSSYEFLNYSYDPKEPKGRVCGEYASASRVKFLANDQITSVYAKFSLPFFYKLYGGVVTNEANHIGYGFPMGMIEMHCGVNGLEANGVAYGNFAEDGDWEADTDPENFFPYTDWWSEFGPFYGDWLTSSAIPEEVGDVTIDGIPLVEAQWTGREANFNSTNPPVVTTIWKVTPLETTGVFEFYTYP